jgi:hypothetical protein
MKATSARRKLIVIVLLVLALAGAVVRLLAPDPSVLRDLGTLLLVLWLPVIGSVVGYFFGKLPRRSAPPAFAPELPFNPHLLVTLAPLPNRELQAPVAGTAALFTLILGSEGFTARCAQAPAPGGAPPIEGHFPYAVEFAAPALALPRFSEAEPFVLAAGASAVARGRVLKVLRRQ